MQLTWIYKAGQTQHDDVFKRHYLIDESSSRICGLVEVPIADEICFRAEPEGKEPDKRYLSLEQAKAYVEFCAESAHIEECTLLEAALTPESSQKETQPVPEKQKRRITLVESFIHYCRARWFRSRGR